MTNADLTTLKRRYKNTHILGDANSGRCILYDTTILTWTTDSITVLPIQQRFRTKTTTKRINEFLALKGLPQRLHTHKHSRTGEILLYFSNKKLDKWHDQRPAFFSTLGEVDQSKMPNRYYLLDRRKPDLPKPEPLEIR